MGYSRCHLYDRYRCDRYNQGCLILIVVAKCKNSTFPGVITGSYPLDKNEKSGDGVIPDSHRHPGLLFSVGHPKAGIFQCRVVPGVRFLVLFRTIDHAVLSGQSSLGTFKVFVRRLPSCYQISTCRSPATGWHRLYRGRHARWHVRSAAGIG